MKERVYVETSVVSYLASRPSRDLVVAARQELTRQWWSERSTAFEVVISELVREEACRGAAEAAQARLKAIETLPILATNGHAADLAERLVQEGPIPRESAAVALHIAIAAVHGIDYLLTWNCKHLANASLRNRVEAIVAISGYACPVICTPEELMED